MNSARKDNLLIEIDRDLCIGAASCSIIAPNTFVLDDQGKVDILEGELDEAQAIIAAADSCPVRAITITEVEGQKQGQTSAVAEAEASTRTIDPVAHQDILNALKTVLDPELGINIVDLG